jgi:aldose 1-epimerase
MGVTSEPWGTFDGKDIQLFTITDEIEVKLTNYGGSIVSVRAPDRAARMGDVVLGFDSLDEYLGNKTYQGATVGRYANRIKGGRFELNGEEYVLVKNTGSDHLHGGLMGFDKVVWTPEVLKNGVRFYYKSMDLEEGYPGTLDVSVMFKVEGDSLAIDYYAETTKPTVLNLTNHAYFNLAEGSDAMGHRLWIDANQYTPMSDALFPLGVLESVEDTPFDFREEFTVGDRIDEDNIQLKRGGGYDHNYVLNQITNPQMRLTEPESGRVVEVSTTMPGVQLYTGNFMDGSEIGRSGPIPRRGGICLETQFFPDSPNNPDFPSTVLRPGEKYIEKTVYRFTTVS